MALTASTTSAYLKAAKSDFLSLSTPDVTVLDISDYDYKRPRVSSKTWRQLIKKIWGAAQFCCRRCGHWDENNQPD
jgi:hypothetical protein